MAQPNETGILKHDEKESTPIASIIPTEPDLNGAQVSKIQYVPDLILHHPRLEHIEDKDKYEKGGYHPVLLNDTFDNGRYRIIHKLGHGGSSTVWLARDKQVERYVALKVLCAHISDEVLDIKILDYLKVKATSHPGRQYIGFLDDSFRIQGPNGSHLCLVSGVLGPSLSELMESQRQLRGSVARRVARQLTQAVAYLHSEGICHGDLTAANIAFELENFDHWTDDELFSQIGKPVTEATRTVSGQAVPDSAPRYVVQPASFANCVSLRSSIRVIDFGVAFFVDDPPADLSTPPSFTAPEAWFEMAAGKSTDLWALGCTLYALRSGIILVQLLWGGTPPEVIGKIYEFLGPLPERWDRMWFDEMGMPKPKDALPNKDRSWTDPERKEDDNLQAVVAYMTDEYHGPVRDEDRVERVKRAYEKAREARGHNVIYPPRKPTRKLSPDEVTSFADLLGKVLTWEPSERTPAEDLHGHPWFSTEFPDVPTAEDAPPLFQS